MDLQENDLAAKSKESQGSIQLKTRSSATQEKELTGREISVKASSRAWSSKIQPSVASSDIPKKKLSAQQNKPSLCSQLVDLSSKHSKQLFRPSWCVNIALIGMPIFIAFTYILVAFVAEDRSYPNFYVEKLKHPIYSAAYLDKTESEEGTFEAAYSTAMDQQLEFESFFQFANYTNTKRKVGTTEDGDTIKVKSYNPSLDLTAVSSWLPLQCYSSVTYKYNNTLIGYIKNGNQLEEDLIKQIKDIFNDQTALQTFVDKLTEFLEEFDFGGEDEGGSEAGIEEVDGGGVAVDTTNVFEIDPDLLETLGGFAPSPHDFDTSTMGQFTYREFENIKELYDYYQQEGYGWDPEIPGLCFAFQVTENETKDKYELEWFYRDQAPDMYITGPRQDQRKAPLGYSVGIFPYLMAASNGINYMQVFMANSVLQRKYGPEAQIVFFTLPYKIFEQKSSPTDVFVSAYNSLYFFLIVTPLLIHFSIVIGREKESGMKQLMLANGLNPAIHFVSWFLHYTAISLVVSIIYVVALKVSVFREDSFALLFLMMFLALESFFGLVWALQPFINSSRMAFFTVGFFLFLSYCMCYLLDQRIPVVETEVMKQVAFAPLAAAKLTIDTLSEMHYIGWPSNFDNYDVLKKNWSIKLGINAYIANFFVYTLVGIVLDIVLNIQSLPCIKHFLKRQIQFLNTDEGAIHVEGLRERGAKDSPMYNLTFEKSKIYCLIGNDTSLTTRLFEMLAGERNCQQGGKMTICDSDFFIRSRKRPRISEFLTYRSQNVVLDPELTAAAHLNMFAHFKGSQKFRSTRVLCDRLLPQEVKVAHFSESQRQCLQTLLAFASENSKIILLDEPTMGLGPQHREEIIRVLWSLKKDRYIIIQSSDTELVNVLADSVIKVLPTGAEQVKNQMIDRETASYKLIVQVENGKPSEYLVRYLSMEVPQLTLEYHTELLTYYILPNITNALLLKKVSFLECNMEFLGLINFEFVSLSAFELAKRDVPIVVPAEMKEKFDESVEDQSFDEVLSAQNGVRSNENEPALEVDARINSQSPLSDRLDDKEMQTQQLSHGDPAEALDQPISAQIDAEEGKLSPQESNNEQLIQSERVDEQQIQTAQIPRPQTTPLKETPHADSFKNHNDLANSFQDDDPEMKELMNLTSQPFVKPKYNGDFHYDFKRHRASRTFCCVQFIHILVRHVKEHWSNKARFLALLTLPSLFVYMGWHFARYFYNTDVPSHIIAPDLYPLKNKIVVNENTQVGGKDTKKWVEKMPMFKEAFDVTYINTDDDADFYNFENTLYDYCINNAYEYPWSYGSYQFYDMDEERHSYKFISYVNITDPFTTQYFPQFMIESVMKNAMNDDNFEMKVRSTPFPAPAEMDGRYFTSLQMEKINDALTMNDTVGFWSTQGLSVLVILVSTWIILNSYTTITLMRERISQRKHFMEYHGQSRIAYWLARFAHDFLFYLPVSLVGVAMMHKFEPQMVMAPQLVFLQPFLMLPFIYVVQHMFMNEVTAVLMLVLYQIVIQQVFPYLLMAVRVNPETEVSGDSQFKMMKLFPLEAVSSSIMFSHKLLEQIKTYRENNFQGIGEPVITDEEDNMNGKADLQWTVIHIFAFWFILLALIEYRLPCQCCSQTKKMTQEDNDTFFGRDETDLERFDEDDGESSEAPQIFGDGDKLQLRFNAKQKPRKELAYKIMGLKLRSYKRCCGCFCRCAKPKKTLVNDLQAQIQAGTKFAIVSGNALGKTQILNTLLSRRSAYHVAGVLKKQQGRRHPVYTSQQDDVLFEDLSLGANLSYYSGLGSIHPILAKQMVVAFGMTGRQGIQVRNLNANERKITQLILALAGSNSTVILDEPFTGLTNEQTIKLVKIIRQKIDCTIIVTAKSKQQIEMLQPHQILTIKSNQDRRSQTPQITDQAGYLLALRMIKTLIADAEAPQQDHIKVPDTLRNNQHMLSSSSLGVSALTEEELNVFLIANFGLFERLRGKRRSTVISAIRSMMKKAKMSPEVADEIALMVYENMEMLLSAEQLMYKIQIIQSLYQVIVALCRRFGEVHLEQRYDDYAVLRVVFNETYRQKGIDDSFSDQNPAFSSLVDFVNSNECIRTNTRSCDYLGSQQSVVALGLKSTMSTGSKVVKMFRYVQKSQSIERVNPNANLMTDQPSQASLQPVGKQ